VSTSQLALPTDVHPADHDHAQYTTANAALAFNLHTNAFISAGPYGISACCCPKTALSKSRSKEAAVTGEARTGAVGTSFEETATRSSATENRTGAVGGLSVPELHENRLLPA